MLSDFKFPSEEMLASFVGKDILSAEQFSQAELEAVLGVAGFYEQALAEGRRAPLRTGDNICPHAPRLRGRQHHPAGW